MKIRVADFTPFGTGKYKGTSPFEQRDFGILQPKARKLLEEVGDEKVTTLEVARTTIANKKLVDLSLGKLPGAVKKSGLSETYHTVLIINRKYVFDKDIVVDFKRINKEYPDKLYIPIPYTFDETILDFIYNTREYMGRRGFSTYDVTKNNCQVFVESALKANGLWNKNPKVKDFVKQDIERVFANLPAYQKPLVDIATHAAAVWNKLTEGEGTKGQGVRKKRTNTNPWIAHVKKYAKEHNIPYNEAVKKASSTYRR